MNKKDNLQMLADKPRQAADSRSRGQVPGGKAFMPVRDKYSGEISHCVHTEWSVGALLREKLNF
jgi:hypothetical protein